jgi:CheY-like chemotaxis protein
LLTTTTTAATLWARSSLPSGTGRSSHETVPRLALLRNTPADLILCDIRMPGMDGLTFAKAIRTHRERRGVKLVAVTGLSDETDAVRLRRAGFDGHLVKPLDYDALLAALDRLLWMPPKR